MHRPVVGLHVSGAAQSAFVQHEAFEMHWALQIL
jgi:hypothetical protein